MAKLDGRVSVVTGAARGIGKATALELARLGSDIVIAARTETPRRTIPGTLGETAAAVQAIGRRVLSVRADLALQEDIERVFERRIRPVLCFRGSEQHIQKIAGIT